MSNPQKILGYSSVFFSDISAGPEHNLALWHPLSYPWVFPPDLLADPLVWETIGVGYNAPKKLNLRPPSIIQTVDREEWKKVSSLFKHSLRGTQFQINKAYAIKNQALETAFDSELHKLLHKWKDAPHLFKKEDWKNTKQVEERNHVSKTLSDYCQSFPWNSKLDVCFSFIIFDFF